MTKYQKVSSKTVKWDLNFTIFQVKHPPNLRHINTKKKS